MEKETFSPYVIHDEHRIKQILLNLQSNALKYTQEGEIKIIVSIQKSLTGNTKNE